MSVDVAVSWLEKRKSVFRRLRRLVTSTVMRQVIYGIAISGLLTIWIVLRRER